MVGRQPLKLERVGSSPTPPIPRQIIYAERRGYE